MQFMALERYKITWVYTSVCLSVCLSVCPHTHVLSTTATTFTAVKFRMNDRKVAMRTNGAKLTNMIIARFTVSWHSFIILGLLQYSANSWSYKRQIWYADWLQKYHHQIKKLCQMGVTWVMWAWPGSCGRDLGQMGVTWVMWRAGSYGTAPRWYPSRIRALQLYKKLRAT